MTPQRNLRAQHRAPGTEYVGRLSYRKDDDMQQEQTDTELYAKLRVFNDAIRATGMGAYYGPSRGVSSLTREQFLG